MSRRASSREGRSSRQPKELLSQLNASLSAAGRSAEAAGAFSRSRDPQRTGQRVDPAPPMAIVLMVRAQAITELASTCIHL
jgi:hypothetical protein